jgi:succinate dehydrogenase/fumarate reductase cytochrome b subunit
MFSIHGLAGAILLLYTLIVIFRGRVTVSDGNARRSTTWISRSEKPLQFWLFVLVMLALAAVLFFNVFNLPF